MRNFKIISYLLAVILLVGMFSFVGAQEAAFEDIIGHWAENDIIELAQNGIINGETPVTYNPDASVSREGFVKLLTCVFNSNFDSKTGVFSDVAEDSWSNPYIAYALEAKIITESEYSGGFKPETPITRDEAALWISRAMGLTEGQSIDFSDVGQIKNKVAVQKVVAAGILKGSDNNTFKPAAATTRAEAAVIIKRIMNCSKPANVKKDEEKAPAEVEDKITKKPAVANTEGMQAVKIATGRNHYAIVKTDGTVWMGEYKIVSGKYEHDVKDVTKVEGIDNAVSVTATDYATFVLRSDGTVWGWGSNANGQLGIGSTEDQKKPVKVSGLENVVAIDGGGNHVLAIKSDGTVWGWGKNDCGQLGLGVDKSFNRNEDFMDYRKEMDKDEYAPIEIPNSSGAIDVQAGNEHTVVLKSDGTVWTCGSNVYGQLGRQTFVVISYELKMVIDIKSDEKLKNIATISAGDFHTLATVSDGTAWKFGYTAEGRIGGGEEIATIASYDKAKNSVSRGTAYLPVYPTLIIDDDKRYFSLNETKKKAPVNNIKSVFAGYKRSLFIDNDGVVWSTGDNPFLANESQSNRMHFREMKELKGIAYISAGGIHGLLALKSDGTVLLVDSEIKEVMNIF